MISDLFAFTLRRARKASPQPSPINEPAEASYESNSSTASSPKVSSSMTGVGWGHWKSQDNRTRFFHDLAQRLNISDLSGWYNVSKEDIVANGGT